ncbi:hypothetical protein [Marinobacter arenosus]|uniref:hypothetical protein n=1 Tax=Marinobacter arenosus TaxID=2856822 RepID=UPI001C4C398F|nr:hypothetical protein [Marinobacter arenosus]MBW0149274.1 hypothetical protein [Marinobacter arenosus]
MKYAEDYSGWGNEVLYRMCSERPLHDDVDTVVGKLWIIGRAYSASIERKAGGDFNIEDAAQLLIESGIDVLINSLNKIDRVTADNIHEVLKAHKVLTDTFANATGIEKRSLASKYLHFHAPRSVFIYDSIANREIRARLERKRFDIPREFDDAYSAFCYRCLHYRDFEFEPRLGELATPRKLDMELLGYRAL